MELVHMKEGWRFAYLVHGEQYVITTGTLIMQELHVHNCVAAVNEVGGGNPSCQTVITHEAGIHVYMIHYVDYSLETHA